MKYRRLLAATRNRNKLAEISTVAREFGVEIVSPDDLCKACGLGAIPEVDETADTFFGNARLKADAFCRWGGMPAIGDDSGLEVECLDGRPGVYSARYAGEGATDRDRITKIMTEIRAVEAETGVRNRNAAFRCVLVLAEPDGQRYEAEALLPGVVLDEPRGTNGFGYDPIIYLPSLGATLAEVDFAVTCTKGFRALATRKLLSAL